MSVNFVKATWEELFDFVVLTKLQFLKNALLTSKYIYLIINLREVCQYFKFFSTSNTLRNEPFLA
jgi:hypothetical protein